MFSAFVDIVFYYTKVVNKWMTSDTSTWLLVVHHLQYFGDGSLTCCWNKVVVLMYILDSCYWIQISMMETHSSFRFTHFTCLKHLRISIFAMYYIIIHNAPIHCSKGISYLSNLCVCTEISVFCLINATVRNGWL